MADPTGLGLVEAGEKLRRREVSARDLTEAALDAAARLQPALNAFIHLEPEQARRMADAADAELDAGRWRGPLHGVPLAHKDVFHRAGSLTTSGSRITRDFRASDTSPVIERLDAAGQVDLGGLNMAEFCVGPTGHNDAMGHCRNPWDTDRVSGGSSSGSGASVAARIVFGSIGSDTGGSIRLPAGMCGVTGLKTSHGLVSLRAATRRCPSLDVFGPIARSARDAAALLDVIAGYDPADPWSRHVPTGDYLAGLEAPLPALRIGVPRNHLLPEASDRVMPHHAAALEALARLGCRLVEIDMPDPEELYAATLVINRVEASWVHGEWIRSRREDYNLSTISRIADGFEIAAVDYLVALETRAVAQARFDAEVFAKVDVLYCPLLLDDVPTIEETDIRAAERAAGIVHRVTKATRWVSLVGLPALVVPIGFSASRMPVAAQLIGPMFEEARLLRLGHAYQGVTDWHRQVPPNAA